MNYDFLIVGSGFFGSVIAERLSNELKKKILMKTTATDAKVVLIVLKGIVKNVNKRWREKAAMVVIVVLILPLQK